MKDSEKTVLKHEYISRTIRSWLLDGRYRPGDRLPTNPELCEYFSANNRTVAAGIKPLVREGFLETAPRRGTIVKNLPIPPKNNMVLFMDQIHGDVYSESTVTLTSRLLDERLCPIFPERNVLAEKENYASFLDCFLSRQTPYGIIINGTTKVPVEYIEENKEKFSNLIFTVMGRNIENFSAPRVIIDTAAAGRIAVEHFASKKVKEIFYIAIYEYGYKGEELSLQMQIKNAIVEHCKKYGVTVNEEIFHKTFFEPHRKNPEYMKSLLKDAGPETGIFAYQDSWIQRDVLPALKDLGKENIPLLGCYNTPHAAIGKFPSLDFQLPKIAEIACDMLTGKIKERKVLIPPVLVDHS